MGLTCVPDRAGGGRCRRQPGPRGQHRAVTSEAAPQARRVTRY